MTDDPPSPLSTKEVLRRQMLHRRKELTADYRAAASAKIAQNLFSIPQFSGARALSLYASFGPEIATHGLIGELLARGQRVALPRVVHWKKELELHIVPSFPDGMEKGDFGILEPTPERHPEIVEPADLDVIIVPALLYDRTGYRIGYGGGYYDRLLGRPHQALKIGVAFACQIADAFEHAPWDRPVDVICTDEEVIRVDRQ